MGWTILFSVGSANLALLLMHASLMLSFKLKKALSIASLMPVPVVEYALMLVNMALLK